ncbi:MAG: methylated-DNA/protein-cysteine methyltransferase [Sphingomonas bacterium]|uniref:methylated-DNA--[protein]-cysteine S-methyltransferase n=1 Tax=Sphingomonas bacterium TaxID=1895847 RepID=UPI0026213EE7|nr:methylated-DNA--[protein]-cysteine S-methyltransferase [Sphingomonas bacterium]MDB5705374.1 methylated-DNA/protein-cysteine methyltransferase [Sphingomonas bacterium]
MRHYQLFDTASGVAAIAWSAAGIIGFRLPASSAEATERALLRRFPGAVRAEPPAEIAETIAAAQLYFAGGEADFSDVRVDLGEQEPFFAQVYDRVRRLGWGETTTYGAVAKELGAGPEAARDVGQAMASNPVPLIIPCHRVLATGGKVGGFSAPGGAESKVRMLAIEGVDLTPPAPAQQGFGF